MLPEAQVKEIAKLLRIPEDKLLTAIKADTETAVDIPAGLTVLAETELTTLKNTEYTNGKTKGVEIAVKETKDAMGLEFTGKTIDGLIKAANAKALEEAKIPADDRVTALTKDVETLRANYTKLENESKSKDELVERAKTQASLFKTLPSLGEGQIGVDKIFTLMQADGYDVKLEGNTLVLTKDGEVVKDNLSKPVPVTDGFTNYAKEAKLWREPVADDKGKGGRGAGDKGPALVFTKQSEVKKHFEDNGKSLLGSEYRSKIQQLKKENPDFDLNG